MNRYLFTLRTWVESLGTVGAIGAGLAVCGAALYLSAVRPAHDEVHRLESRLARLDRGEADTPEPAERAIGRGTSQLERFAQYFPPLSEAPEWVLKIHTIAAQNKLALETGEYRLTLDKDSDLARYQITLPLRGTYWQVRLFLAQLLDEVPAVALDDVVIKRDSVSARNTETRVRLVMYLVDRK